MWGDDEVEAVMQTSLKRADHMRQAILTKVFERKNILMIGEENE